MPTTGPRYPKEEFARRGDAIYERDIRPWAEPEHNGKYVVIDIETGAYEIDPVHLAAVDRLYARLPDAQPWALRIGYRYTRRFGGRRRVGSEAGRADGRFIVDLSRPAGGPDAARVAG
ncbi:MAG: hypothetical protein K2X87_33865 [Gemmataceae bacterium]|nr:hypothetical protein [Gemmataceae bacterium]